MIKVLIVEDEEIIRKGLVYTVDWLSMGCMVVADAGNGFEGLDMMKLHLPDVVITDIKMPKLDGINMLEEAEKQSLTDFKSIILTSYSEFDYAKKAIQLRVFDYILKPVDEDKLKEVICRVKQTIEKERVNNSILEIAGKKTAGELLDLNFYINTEVSKNIFVSRALQEIKDNFNRKISVESIAEEMGVSASYLSRRFKDATSQTFLDMLNKYRVQKAIEFMERGIYRIYEVSDMTGFSDYKHFCSVFKKYTNTSPTEFMKHNGCIMHKKERSETDG